jgi:hypothetical protein
MRGYCGRLALILCCLRLACRQAQTHILTSNDVTGDDMRGAASLIAYYKAHARKVYALLNADLRVAAAGRVLRCLAANPDLGKEGFTRRDLYQHVRRYFKNPEALDGPLQLLAEHHYKPGGAGRSAAAPRGTPLSPRQDGRAHRQAWPAGPGLLPHQPEMGP